MHGKELLTLLLMFDVDPSLRSWLLACAAPSKDNLQSRQTTMHACYLSNWGLEIKNKLQKPHITHALGREKYSFIIFRMNQLTINVETGHRSLILILGSSSYLSSNYFSWILLRLEERLKGWDKWIRQLGRVSLLSFFSSKWYPYPFFYRLEGARYLDEPSIMHGWVF